jgi:hypothetical protein
MFKKLAVILMAMGVCCASIAQVPVIQARHGLPQRAAKVVITLQLPTTAMDGTPLVGNYVLKNINLYISEVSIPCDTSAIICNLKPSVILTPNATGIPTSYTYLGVPTGATIYVRADACNINGCSYLSSQLSAINNRTYTLTIKESASNQTFRTDAPPETPQIIITVQPE